MLNLIVLIKDKINLICTKGDMPLGNGMHFSIVGPAEYIIATTKIINGENWIPSLMDTLTPLSTNPF